MTRPLLLNGFMATGKSSVGRLLAEKRGAQFVDLDARIESETGSSIRSLFQERGEAGFRALESRILLELLGSAGERPLVVALGGGALLDRALRIELLFRAFVVTLTASPHVIVRRVEEQDGASGARPLLGGTDPEERVRFLLAGREAAYAECHASIATDDRSLEEIATAVEEAIERDPVPVAAGTSSYVVDIGTGLLEERLPRLLGNPSSALLVSDTTVAGLHADPVRRVLQGRLPYSEVLLVPGEEHKNLRALEAVFDRAFEASVDRKGLFVGLGGGVVTDMTGFAAATWVRGVRWIGLPTTLLSMVDASVGGKTAVDHRSAKNSVGAFWQPSGVICDVNVLATESERAFVGALAEVVKTALIGDAELFALLEDRADAILRRDPAVIVDIVERSIRVKARVVSLDERESGIRAHLNLGHTIGHALEANGGYTALTHGEAVALGLVAALRLGERLGETPPSLTERTVRLAERLRLPFRLDADALARATHLLGHDKKRAGDQIRFVFAHDVGHVGTRSVSLDDLVRWTPELAG